MRSGCVSAIFLRHCALSSVGETCHRSFSVGAALAPELEPGLGLAEEEEGEALGSRRSE